MPAPSPTRHVAHYERVLGTSLELQVVGGDGPLAEEAALAEIDRLESIFSRFRPDSEFARWETTFDEDVPVSRELAEVLAAAEAWRERTGGAFDPVMAKGGGPRWTVRGETARRLTPRKASLHALAKGYIVDRAAEAASGNPSPLPGGAGVREKTIVDRGSWIAGKDPRSEILDRRFTRPLAPAPLPRRGEGFPEAVLLNVGGDLRHIGPDAVKVAIADPLAPHENAEPIARIAIRNQGVATSGTYRRGAHLIDPRTGEPALHLASATVVAATAADADALATACFVLDPKEGFALVDRMDAAVLLVLPCRKLQSNRAWRRLS